MFNELNSSKVWTKETTNFEYIKLREFLDVNGWDVEIPVFGYYINKLKKGEAVTIIAPNIFINLPSHAVKVFKKMTDEQNKAIADGKLVLKEFKEIDTDYGNKTIVFKYCDAE